MTYLEVLLMPTVIKNYVIPIVVYGFFLKLLITFFENSYEGKIQDFSHQLKIPFKRLFYLDQKVTNRFVTVFTILFIITWVAGFEIILNTAIKKADLKTIFTQNTDIKIREYKNLNGYLYMGPKENHVGSILGLGGYTVKNPIDQTINIIYLPLQLSKEEVETYCNTDTFFSIGKNEFFATSFHNEYLHHLEKNKTQISKKFFLFTLGMKLYFYACLILLTILFVARGLFCYLQFLFFSGLLKLYKRSKDLKTYSVLYSGLKWDFFSAFYKNKPRVQILKFQTNDMKMFHSPIKYEITEPYKKGFIIDTHFTSFLSSKSFHTTQFLLSIFFPAIIPYLQIIKQSRYFYLPSPILEKMMEEGKKKAS